MRHRLSPDQYVDGILKNDRFLLSQAITLIESRRADDEVLAQQVLERILLKMSDGLSIQSMRIGITGVPGVGKSLFIETFGTYLTSLGHRVAILTIDPSSQRSGGSLLGDKTRMETLSVNPNAYIRPSPAGDALGGVAHRTRETILLCEAAGFDIILVETVGVGQSETAVHSLVDFFLLLMLAGAGDELQGLKRGIMELADALVITKADGANQEPANRARIEYANALHLFPPTDSGWVPPALTCSALMHTGIVEIWQAIEAYQQLTTQNGYRTLRRQEQQLTWFRSTLQQRLDSLFYEQPAVRQQLAIIEEQVKNGILLPAQAIELLVSQLPPFGYTE